MSHISLGDPRGFSRFWAAQASSLTGTQVARIAIPLIAIQSLSAGPFEVGVLSAFTTLPFLLIGLFVGAWVDRMSSRRVLIFSDLGRAAVLALLSLVGVFGSDIGLLWLYVVAGAIGVLTVFFDVAYGTFPPMLVVEEGLERANSRLALSDTLSRVVGPGLGGWLVQSAGGPVAIFVSVVSYLGSAALLRGTHPRRESGEGGGPSLRVHRGGADQSMRRQLADGFSHIAHSAQLRALLVAGAVLNFFDAGVSALLLLFLTQVVGMRADLIGVAIAIGAAGGVAAAIHVPRLRSRFGVWPVMAFALVLVAAARLLQGFLAEGGFVHTFALLAVTQIAIGCGAVAFNVLQVTLRQHLTPDVLLGRMTATMRTVTWGALPLGAVVAGVAAEILGLRAAVFVMGLGIVLAPAAIGAVLRFGSSGQQGTQPRGGRYG